MKLGISVYRSAKDSPLKMGKEEMTAYVEKHTET